MATGPEPSALCRWRFAGRPECSSLILEILSASHLLPEEFSLRRAHKLVAPVGSCYGISYLFFVYYLLFMCAACYWILYAAAIFHMI